MMRVLDDMMVRSLEGGGVIVLYYIVVAQFKRINFVTKGKNVIGSKKIFQNSLFYSGGTNRKVQRKTVQP